MAKKLYVGNLSFDVAGEELEVAFSEFGEVISATVVRDRISGRSRGFGFVEFADEESAEKAKADLNGKEIKGRAIRVEQSGSINPLLQGRSQELSANAVGTRSMEERINSILNGESYEKLDDLLDFDRNQVLDILCSKTAKREINLETETGMQTWQSVVNYFESNCDRREVQSMFSKLAECSRKELRTRANEFIYDMLFALNGGVNADIDAGYWAADKYARFTLKRRVKKLQKEFRG